MYSAGPYRVCGGAGRAGEAAGRAAEHSEYSPGYFEWSEYPGEYWALTQVAPGKLLVVDRGNNSLKLVGLTSV